MVNSFIEKIQHVIYISSAGRKTHLLDDSISEENHRFESMGKHSETPKSKPLFPSKYQSKKKKKKKTKTKTLALDRVGVLFRPPIYPSAPFCFPLYYIAYTTPRFLFYYSNSNLSSSFILFLFFITY